MKRPLADLRERLKLCEASGLDASAKELRRKIRALERGTDPDAPCIDMKDRRPRKRVVLVRRPIAQGRYFVRLACGHSVTVNGVPSKTHPTMRAPYTAICNVCTP